MGEMRPDKGKTTHSPLAGREYSASAADNVRLPTKRVVTEPQQADHGPSETRNPGNVGLHCEKSDATKALSMSTDNLFTWGDPDENDDEILVCRGAFPTRSG